MFFSLFSVFSELHAAKNTTTFKKRFKLNSFIVNFSYQIVNVAIYLAYTQLTGSTVLNEYPKLTSFAYGAQYLQAVHRIQVSSCLQ